MKIALVTPGGFDRSGRERVIPVFLWLVERLSRRHEVHVYTLNQYPYPDTYPLLGATVLTSAPTAWPGVRPIRSFMPCAPSKASSDRDGSTWYMASGRTSAA